MLINWTKTEAEGGVLHSSQDVEGYEIFEPLGNEGYYVRRTVAECDDIGPTETFKDAEDIILKIGIALINFEEKLWCVCAAQAMQAMQADPVLGDGTASLVEDTAP